MSDRVLTAVDDCQRPPGVDLLQDLGEPLAGVGDAGRPDRPEDLVGLGDADDRGDRQLPVVAQDVLADAGGVAHRLGRDVEPVVDRARALDPQPALGLGVADEDGPRRAVLEEDHRLPRIEDARDHPPRSR